MGEVITVALKGQNGKAIGSSDYFSNLNAGILANLMQDAKKYHYRQSLQKLAYKIYSALEEIYYKRRRKAFKLSYEVSGEIE